jgi:FAD/FMN-containing dehydrogenase
MATEQLDRTAVSDDEIAALAATFKGALLRPGEEGYEEARQIWNAMSGDRMPSLVARCTGTADVVAAVNFARQTGRNPTVRGGGHGAPGYAVADGEMMIDLSLMKGVIVDPVTRHARVQGGATWADYDRETQLYGLATPGGAVSDTGVAGLTLGGGYGWLSRAYGQTADNLMSAQLVTADGEVLHVDAGSHPDLFWALKGGGGNFGVVTSFELQTHPVGPEIVGGARMYPFADAREIYHFYREYCRTAPEQLGLNCFATTAPELDFIPPEVQGEKIMMVLACWHGPREEADEVLRPLREFGTPFLDMIEPRSYTEMQSMFDAGGAPGRRSYWKAGYVDEMSDEGLDTMIEYASKLSSPLSFMELALIGGAITRFPEGATGPRSPQFNQLVISTWEDPAEDELHIGFSRELFDAMRPFHNGGVYVNYLSVEGADRVHDAYGGPVFERLVQVKRRYDPTNLFRHNQNIPTELP